MEKLNINNTFLGVKDKYALLQHLSVESQIHLGNVAYIGDDVNDLANMCSVGWSLAPRNAVNIIKQNADIVLSSDSLKGAIREACAFLLNYNKRF